MGTVARMTRVSALKQPTVMNRFSAYRSFPRVESNRILKKESKKRKGAAWRGV